MCVYPVGRLVASAEAGEPCVPLLVRFCTETEACSTVDDNELETTRFLVGHAYALRATWRAKAGKLWVQLRDPRRVRLFWASWPSVLAAGGHICYVYVCSTNGHTDE